MMIKSLLTITALIALAEPVLAHCKWDMCSWPVPVELRTNGPKRSGPVHGAPGLFWEDQQWCWFDKRTNQRYGHCDTPHPVVYNCKTKTSTFLGYQPGDHEHGLAITPGTPGDQVCRKNGYLWSTTLPLRYSDILSYQKGVTIWVTKNPVWGWVLPNGDLPPWRGVKGFWRQKYL